jgi:hypothetical protein
VAVLISPGPYRQNFCGPGVTSLRTTENPRWRIARAVFPASPSQKLVDNTGMAKRKRLSLSTFDNRLLDGLNSCRQVYAFLDQVKNRPGGIESLRLLKTKEDKRLVEELLPIAQYIQTHYSAWHRIRIRWLSGSQHYDARLYSSGILVENGLLTKRSLLEVTTSTDKRQHLVRELINSGGISFGVKGISRDAKTRKIISNAKASRRGFSTRVPC